MLTEPDDILASGVEVEARPPGKKAQALAMLSGGERALTAVALLSLSIALLLAVMADRPLRGTVEPGMARRAP